VIQLSRAGLLSPPTRAVMAIIYSFFVDYYVAGLTAGSVKN
jgi:hypothetical protein